jgi:ankyrin repeat protein
VLAIELMFFRLGWSAVHWAAGGGHTHCIEALAKAGADVSVVARSSMRICCFIATDGDNLRSDGTTALHWAAQRGHAACIQALLANGADVNVVDKCVNLTSHSIAYSHSCLCALFISRPRLLSSSQNWKNSIAPCCSAIFPFRIYGH